MNELFNVKDKVVVITGGAGILGKGIAAYLAKEGAKVVVLDRSEEAGKALELNPYAIICCSSNILKW